MGDTYREKWFDALPWVLMGRCAAYQEELGCSSFQMVFGQAAVLPGALVVYLKLNDEGTMASTFPPSKLRRYSKVDIEGRTSA